MLIVAPAGFGKSTMLNAWARETSEPVAWVALRAILASVVNLHQLDRRGFASTIPCSMHQAT